MTKYKGILYALISAAAFGIMPMFAKTAYKNGSNPTSSLLFRFLIAGLILLIYLSIKRISIKISLMQFLILIFTGMLGYTFTTITLFMSYNYLDSGLATSLHYIYPALVCIFSFILYKERMTSEKLLSLILSIGGVYSLIAFENKTLNATGIILALLSGLGYAANVISLNLKKVRSLDNRVVTMYICFGTSLGMFIYGAMTHSIILKMNTQIVISYLGLSVVSTIASMIFLLKAIKIIGSSSASILGTFEAVVSIICGILFLNERLTLSLIIGTLMIIACAVILSKEKSNPSESHTSQFKNSVSFTN